MLLQPRFLAAFAIAIGILLVVSANITQPPPPDVHSLEGMAQKDIEEYAIAYSKREFNVRGEPVVTKIADVTGEDLQKVGIMYWGPEYSFVLVVLEGEFDVTKKWPIANQLAYKGVVSHTAFVLDPSNGLAAFITNAPKAINTLAGAELAPSWSFEEVVPEAGQEAIPTAMP